MLREYQNRAVDAIFRELHEKHSTLIVMATGCGKTQVFSEVIKRIRPSRALVLAHREELIFQAAKRIQSFGVETSIEMADLTAGAFDMWDEEPTVISTVQTQNAGRRARMSRFNPDDFSLLVIDEAHHATAPSYRKVINYYRQNPHLRVLGVTATPDRADEQALGQVFQSVAFDYEILDAINDGWLVPIQQQFVTIDGLDFSSIRTTAGDLNGADLAAVMEAEKNLHGIVSSTLEIVGNKRTAVFAVTVKQAEMYSEIFNRHRPGMADWVCGKTPKDQRHEIFKKFERGDTQILVNVGILTEGYDNPAIEVIAQARPTKSRALYSQIIGRATRPLPGIVDGYNTPEERRDSIGSSAKPSCLIIDFVGNSGRHKLMTTADILGGKNSNLAVLRAVEKAKIKGQPLNMAEAIEEEQRRIQEEKRQAEAARRAHLVAKAQYSTREISPFDVFQLQPDRVKARDAGRVLSEKQLNLLRKQGIDPASISFAQAKQLIGELIRRFEGNLCSYKQAKLLQKHSYDTKNMTRADATKLIDALAKNGWRRPAA
jgi:superfamily II DNA or RNA helicase